MQASKTSQILRRMGVALFSAFIVAAPVKAAVNLAEVPLYLTASVEPNIMFVLDDSGSMHFEIMPDDYALGTNFWNTARYVFPRADDVYGPDDYNNHVPTVDSGSGYNALTRSPQINTVYYNPAVTYTPWVRSDGTLYPDASLTCALHNPERVGTGQDYCRNLTVNNTGFNNNGWVSCSSASSCNNPVYTAKTFWPATYFWHNGGNIWDWNNYTQVEIRATTSSYSGHGRAARTDCVNAAASTCTYAEEIQNFANWYTYYRSRILAARAGIGRAFAAQGEGMRVGFGAINKGALNGPPATTVDGVSNTKTVVRGVRRFSGADRDGFFDLLYQRDVPALGTPLRLALDSVGKYYERSDNRGPWGNTPGVDDPTAHVQCRQSYTVLMTDGYWSGGSSYDADTSAAQQNVDDTAGSLITRPAGSTEPDFQYSPGNPFRDGYSNTLADVAMYYWNRDLRTDLENEVPTNSVDVAFWQHMVVFGVGLGVSGSVNPADAWAAVQDPTAVSVTWPVTNNTYANCTDGPAGTCPARLDDLLHAAVNSRGGFFSASDPDTFANELGATLAAIRARTESSSSSVAANSTRLDAGTLVYQARFDSSDWSGQLLAFQVDTSGELITPADWDAGQLLPAPASRNIYTTKDSTNAGVAFAWTDLSAAQQAQLNDDALGVFDGKGALRLDWLRGDQANEATNGAGFRARPKSVLGDIVNSDPVFVGTQDFGNSALPGVEGTSYTTFRADAAYTSRKKMLYVGANDGMLHGFDAETGVERLAYVPKAVFQHLSKLTSPDYVHRFYVNGSPRSADAYIDYDTNGTKEWRTVLVGTTGAGARSVFALDVTDPLGFGAGNVLWEFTDADNAELGFTVGEPTIARLKAGSKWVALVGNGYNSFSQTARLFIIDLETGAELKVLDTGVGDASNPNGLHAPVPVDVDGDRIADFVYAGDLQGNLWKFDLTGNAITDWKVARPGGVTQPLFVAEDANGARQPITVRPAVGPHPNGGVMVYFGTGKFFEVGDEVVPGNPPLQAFYGIWDKGAKVTTSLLEAQTIDWEGSATFTLPNNNTVQFDLRVVSENTVDYATQYGWYLNLVYPNPGTGDGERVISRAILRSGRIIFTSMIPEPDPCRFGGDGWLMELDAISGGRIPEAVFDLNGDGYFNEQDWVVDPNDPTGNTKIPPSSIKSKEGIINTPGVIEDGDKEYKFASGSSGNIQRVVESSGDAAGRKGWWQLR